MQDRRASWWPWLAAAISLLLFGLTSTPLPVPEISASFLADHLRLTPFPPMDRPLWGWLVRGLTGLGPAAQAVAWANGLSVVLGALVVWLLGRAVERSLSDRRMRSAPGMDKVAGFAAGMALATSIPFWMVSNRAHPATLGLALFLGALNLLQNYPRSGHRRWLFLGTFVYAVGLAELPTLLVFAPAVAGSVLISLWQRKQLRLRTVAVLALVLGVAPGLWMLAAWDYARLPAADWREMSGWAEVLRYELITYRDVLLHSVPRQGWLILLFTSLLPWTVALVAIRGTLPQQLKWGPLLLQTLVMLLVIAILWNAPLTPWYLLGTQPLLVTPYVFVAMAFAYLLVHASALIVMQLERMQRASGWGITVAMAFLALSVLGVAVVRSAPQISTRSAVPVQHIVTTMLDELRGRDTLVANGLLSDHLRLRAFQQGRSLTLIDLPFSDHSGYRRYLASLFDDPRRQSLAMAGLEPALVDWLSAGQGVGDHLALQMSPDLWLREGYEPLPMGTLFLGASAITTAEVESVREEMERFGPQAQQWVADLQNTAPRLKPLAQALAAHWARVANDTGVFFEHCGRRDEARKAYAQARRLDPANLSAAANLVVLGQSAGWSGIDVEEADLALAVAPHDQPLYATVSRYGHLRRREATQLVGMAGGSGNEAPGESDVAWNAAVEAYRKGDRAEARRRLEKLTAERTEFDPAWILLANLAYEQGDDATLQKCVRQMRTVRREWPEIIVLLGRQALDRQDLLAARDYFERAVLLRPTEMPILELLLQLDLRERDFDRAEARIRQILALRPSSVLGQIGLASVLRAQERYALAESTLQRVLEIQRHPQALAEMALLKLQAGQVDEAKALAEESVTQGPRLAPTHEAMGLVYLRLGDAKHAVESLTRALALDGQRWSSRVYMAAALFQSGQREPALQLARALRKERHPRDKELKRELEKLPE